jgi:protein-S-isoprenylcysteine O-methyltransferase Ste14
MLSAALRLVGMTVVYGLVLFECAGTIDWPAAWIYLAVMTAVMVGYMLVMRRNPDLVAERSKPPSDAKSWDKPLVAIVGLVGPFGLIIVAGLDRRYGWSGPMPLWLQAAGFALVLAGSAITNVAVAANRFFSALIRIQSDRGHQVVETGPYRFVRHPGYLGSLVHMPGAALALGSPRALLLVLVVCAVLVVRTALEDRTLRAELDGYADYATRVRYRLLPGVW